MAEQLVLEVVAHDAATASLQRVQASLRTTELSAVRFGAAAGATMAAVQAALAATATAASRLSEAFREVALNIPARLEQANIALSTMLGSTQRAQQFLTQLAEFARTTPFELPGLITASQRMLAYGFAAEQVIPLLRAVGNATAALGGGQFEIDRVVRALGQMQARTRVQAEEMLQLTEVGIPAWQILAKTLGVDVATAMEMVTKREVEAITFIQAFQQEMMARFGGMMDLQSRTLVGAISNIKDALGIGLSQAFQPLYVRVRDTAVALADFLQTPRWDQFRMTVYTALYRILEAWDQFVARLRLSDQLAEAFERLEGGIARLGVVVPRVLDLVGQIPAQLGALRLQAEPVVGALAAPFEQFAERVLPAILLRVEERLTDLRDLGMFIGQQLGLQDIDPGAIVGSLVEGITAGLDTLATAIETFSIVWHERWLDLRSAITTLYNDLQPQLDALGATISAFAAEQLPQLVTGLQAAVPGLVAQLTALGAEVASVFAEHVAPLLAQTATVLTSALSLVTDALGNLFSLWREGWTEIGPTLLLAWQVIEPVLGNLAGLLGGVVKAAIETTLATFQRWIDQLRALGTFLLTILQPAFDKLGEVGHELNRRLQEGLLALVPQTAAAAETAGTAIGVELGTSVVEGAEAALDALDATVAGEVEQAGLSAAARIQATLQGGTLAQLQQGLQDALARLRAGLGTSSVTVAETATNTMGQTFAQAGQASLAAAGPALAAGVAQASGPMAVAAAQAGAAAGNALGQALADAAKVHLIEIEGELIRLERRGERWFRNGLPWPIHAPTFSAGLGVPAGTVAPSPETAAGWQAPPTGGATWSGLPPAIITPQGIIGLGGEPGVAPGTGTELRRMRALLQPLTLDLTTPGPRFATTPAGVGFSEIPVSGAPIRRFQVWPSGQIVDVPETMPWEEIRQRLEAAAGVTARTTEHLGRVGQAAQQLGSQFDVGGQAAGAAARSLLEARRAVQQAYGNAQAYAQALAAEVALIDRAREVWAQLIRAGQIAVGGIQIAAGLVASQIYGFTTKPGGSGNLPPGTYYGVPVVSPITPGTIVGLQAGGIVTRPTLAVVGEAGPEAVVPLERAAPALRPVQVQITYAPLYGAATPAERQAAARQIVRDLREEFRRQGITF